MPPVKRSNKPARPITAAARAATKRGNAKQKRERDRARRERIGADYAYPDEDTKTLTEKELSFARYRTEDVVVMDQFYTRTRGLVHTTMREKGVTLTEISRRMGVSRKNFQYKLEEKKFSFQDLCRMARALGVEPIVVFKTPEAKIPAHIKKSWYKFPSDVE